MDHERGVRALLPRPVSAGHVRLDLVLYGRRDGLLSPGDRAARLVRSRGISRLRLVRLHLERIEHVVPELNSIVTVRGRKALAEAEMRDAHSGDGPFHGRTIAIRTYMPTRRLTYSCRAFADHVPNFDTAVVRRVREAGFVIVGKTNTPEFGTVAFTESELNGRPRNR